MSQGAADHQALRSAGFAAEGTAVRADTDVRPPRPFLSDLSGRDVARLLHHGWVPCGLALGLAALVVHHEEPTSWDGEVVWSNREPPMPSTVVHAAQKRARRMMRDDCAGLGAEGVVPGSRSVRVHSRECGVFGQVAAHFVGERPDGRGEGLDVYAEALYVGTAITRFRPVSRPPLTITPLHGGGTG